MTIPNKSLCTVITSFIINRNRKHPSKGNAMKNLQIGFIGLGQMGAPMARALIRAGYQVTGFDLNMLPDEQIQTAESSRHIADQSDIVITMLPDGAAVKTVTDDILPVMSQDQILIDCSTIDVATAQSIGVKANQKGIDFLDAPVSGGIIGATAGTLTFMIGGKADIINQVMPLFETMGSKAVHCGEVGTGQIAKICNNMILGATMIATCEAFDMADRLGLDRQKMFDVVSTSSGYSWSMNAYCPAPGIGPDSPSDHDYKPGFSADLMLKDLGLAIDAAHHAGADPRIGQCARQIYTEFVETSGKGMDFSAILPWLNDKKPRMS
ncbi:MAG: 3-hydroxyisobutyrate dehydrogenase [Candidatus Puniceispirillales bacterium]